MTIHRFIMTTDEMATLMDLITDRLKDIESGEVHYGDADGNQEMTEELNHLRDRLSAKVNEAWGHGEKVAC